MAHEQKASSVADEQPDDATVVGVVAVSRPVGDLQLQPTASDPKGDAAKDAQPSSPGEAPPSGLTDQTNFLPTRQVITVFLGLSVALACSFLDQTMYVPSRRSISFRAN